MTLRAVCMTGVLALLTSSTVLADGRQRETFTNSETKRSETNDGYAYEFGVDGLEGDLQSLDATIKARLAKQDACSEALKKSLSDPKLNERSFATVLFEQYRCYDPCRTRLDFDFRNRCVDWKQSFKSFSDATGESQLTMKENCLEKSDYQGFVEGLYRGTFKDGDGTCKDRYIKKQVSMSPPVDFYVILDNSGSMNGVYAEMLNTVLPKLLEMIRERSGDSRILLATHNLARGNQWYAIDGRDALASQSIDAFRQKYSLADGESGEEPLMALLTYGAQAGVKKDVKNVVIVISDEVKGGNDIKGDEAAKKITETFGKELVFVSTLPAGEHSGVDKILEQLGSNGMRTTNGTAAQELLDLMRKHFALHKVDNNIAIPLPKEYRDVKAVSINQFELGEGDYLVLDGWIYFQDHIELKPYEVIEATFEYNPPEPDRTLEFGQAVAWFTNNWSENLEKTKDKAVIVPLRDLGGVIAIEKYIRKLDRMRDSYLRLLMSLSEEMLETLFRSASHTDPFKNSEKVLVAMDQLLGRSKAPDAPKMRKYAAEIRRMLVARALTGTALEAACKVATRLESEPVASDKGTAPEGAFLKRIASVYSTLEESHRFFCLIQRQKN